MSIYRCDVCGNNIPETRNSVKTCSRSCGTKLSWQGATERKFKLSKRLSENNPGTGRPKGSKNVNPYPMENVLKRPQNQKGYQSWLGKKHTEETKQKMSNTRLNKIASGEIKIMASYKGKFKPRNPKKYKGDPSNIIYRSRWELMLMSKFDMHPDVLEWSSEEVIIPYRSPIDGKVHRYFCDFYVKQRNASDGKITEKLIEVKPFAQTRPPKPVKGKPTRRMLNEIATWGVNEAKWKAAKTYCANKGWKWEIITEKELGLRF